MTDDNYYANSSGNDGKANATTQATAIFDAGWLLAATFEFYMQYAIIAIGVVGVISNALVLYALIVHNKQQQKKSGVNSLIINQNSIDLCCSVFTVITFSIRVSKINFIGALGYLVCAIFIGGNAIYCLFNASVINLITITIERYLKVVYPFWSKKHLKRWMTNTAMAFSWIAGILSMGPLGLVTSFVADGICFDYALYFANDEIKTGYGAWNFFCFFLLPLITFVYCYGHIVIVMRKQARVMAGHNLEGSAQNASQAQSERVKWNIIKTMIIVSAFFIFCWSPLNIYVIVVTDTSTSELLIGFLVTLFLTYVNISMNPFIYATKHKGVKSILFRMIICRKRDNVAAVAGTTTNMMNTGGSGSVGQRKGLSVVQ